MEKITLKDKMAGTALAKKRRNQKAKATAAKADKRHSIMLAKVKKGKSKTGNG